MKLTQVKGVSETKATKLEENGYRCAEDLAGANVARVDAIDGLGPDAVVNAIHLVEYNHGQMAHRSINYRCSYCGQGQLVNHTNLKVHEESCDENPNNDDTGGGLFSGVVN